MSIAIFIIFLLGYTAIALEHPLRINKAAPALLTGMLVWSLLMLGHGGMGLSGGVEHMLDELFHHLGEIASILFFLLGAMTVVELMDAHGGLIASAPSRNPRCQPLRQIRGMTPSLLNLPTGCAFRERCDSATAVCQDTPELHEQNGRTLRCFHPVQMPAETLLAQGL